MGGSALAYEHHALGFLLILAVTGALTAGLSWFLWKGRHDITLLIIGAIQAGLGIAVYILQGPA
jgi:hypothetical protein